MKKLPAIGLVALMGCISIFGTRSNAQHLSSKEKAIISIGALTATGNLPELKKQLHHGLDSGLTVNEIKEVIVHAYAYCGFPRSIRGLQTFMTVIDDRKAKGISDESGAIPSVIPKDGNKYERGKAILAELAQASQDGTPAGYSAFSPIIDTFQKEHLFADIFERDVLTYAQRELVTISVISAIGDADPMLKSHFGMSIKTGWTAQQLRQFIRIIKPSIGNTKTNAAEAVLNEVIKSK